MQQRPKLVQRVHDLRPNEREPLAVPGRREASDEQGCAGIETVLELLQIADEDEINGGIYDAQKGWPSGPEFDWPAVPGAVGYLVERAVDDGTYKWTIAGVTCGSPDDIRTVQYDDGTSHLRFRDIVGAHDFSKLSGVTQVTEVLASSSHGFSRVYPTGGCGGGNVNYETIHGVPIGIHTFTTTAQWVQSLDPNSHG